MMKKKQKFSWALVFLLISAMSFGCARYRPSSEEDSVYLQRVQTKELNPIAVSIAALGVKESKKVFGVNLAKNKILPLWIKIENRDPEKSYYFVERSVDENYFPAGEAAYISRIKPGLRLFDKPVLRLFSGLGLFVMPIDHFFVKSANKKMRETFVQKTIKYGWIPPGETLSGFVFVPSQMGLKQVTLDVYGDDIREGKENVKHFDFFVKIPGIQPDYRTKEFENYYDAKKIMNYTSEQELKAALEVLPPYVTNALGLEKGDPVNLVMIGTLDEILEAFTAADWSETEIISLKSILRMIDAFLSKGEYDYSPISPLFLYDRSQDIALQKSRGNINERMHLRLWYSPIHFKGKPVWVGQVSRDIGIRFTTKAWNLMTHQIDPDIDEAAIYTLSDLMYRHRVETYGVFEGGIPRTPEAPGRNLTGDPYYTSGKRVLIELPAQSAPENPKRFFLPVRKSSGA